MEGRIAAFAAVAALLTITPGVDMALVTRNALQLGPRPARLTALGICSGLLVWATLSAIGVAAVFAASAELYTTLRLAGALYLVYLGTQSLLRARRGEGIRLPEGGAVRGRSAYRQGLLNNVLNPKIAVFYTTFLPQFIGPHDPVLPTSLLLASIHAAMGLAWLWAYAGLVARAGNRLRESRLLEAASGLVLVGLGVRLALERR